MRVSRSKKGEDANDDALQDLPADSASRVEQEERKQLVSQVSIFFPPVIIVTDSQADTGGRPFIYGNYCVGLVTQVNQVLNGPSTGPYGSSMSPY